MTATKNKGGRPKSDDPRRPLPFRLRGSVVDKAVELGRDRVEQLIERAKPKPKKSCLKP